MTCFVGVVWHQTHKISQLCLYANIISGKHFNASLNQHGWYIVFCYRDETQGLAEGWSSFLFPLLSIRDVMAKLSLVSGASSAKWGHYSTDFKGLL